MGEIDIYKEGIKRWCCLRRPINYIKNLSEKGYLIELHINLYLFRIHIEETGIPEENFREYDKYAVFPNHIEKSIEAHKTAVFLLAEELVSATRPNNVNGGYS